MKRQVLSAWSGCVAADRRLTLHGVLLLGTMLGALCLHLPGADTVGSDLRKACFVGLLAVGLVIYLSAVRHILRSGYRRRGLLFVLGIAAAMRVALLASDPFLSSDIYRYVWDGRVQAAGINPYRYVPADLALASLRDEAIFPRINRAAYARTIYPPAAQLVFAAVGRLGASVTAMKTAMVGFEVLAVVCLLPLLALAGLPASRVAIYAWNPLVLWSFACDGHVDAVAIGLLALALLLQARRRATLAGGILAGAVLVKFLPIVTVPAFLMGRASWRPALAGAVVTILFYGIYLSASAHVLGFLPAYGSEEGLASGEGFWLLAGLSHIVSLPDGAGSVYVVGVAGMFAALSLRVAWETVDPVDVVRLCRGAAVLAGVATVAISPHYPWYFAWLALPSVVAPIPAVLWLSVAPVFLYLDPLHERFLWPCLVYVPAAALTVMSLYRTASRTEAAPSTPRASQNPAS